MRSKQGNGNAKNLTALSHMVAGNAVRLKMSAHASSTDHGRPPPFLRAAYHHLPDSYSPARRDV